MIMTMKVIENIIIKLNIIMIIIMKKKIIMR